MSAVTRNPQSLSKADLLRILSANLLDQLSKKGWDQADLVRASGLTKDSIHSYCKQKALPRPPALAKLAAALRCKPSDLMPSDLDFIGAPMPSNAAPGSIPPTMEFLPGDAAFARVRLDMVVHATTAIEIMRLLAADDAQLSNDNDVAEQN